MGKGNRGTRGNTPKRGGKRGSNIPKLPTPASKDDGRRQSPTREPTVEQLAEIAKTEDEVTALGTAHGPSPKVEPDGPTLQDCLGQVRSMLNIVAGHRQEAAEAASVAAAARDKAEQKLIALDAERLAHSAEADERSQALDARSAELDQQAAALAAERARLTAMQALVAEKSATLMAREQVLRDGFLEEKAKIMAPLESELLRLEQDREALKVKIATERANAAEAQRNAKAEEAAARANALAELEREEADRRHRLDEELADERRQRQSLLREKLAKAREQAESEWEQELEQQRDLLTRREQVLKARAEELDDRERELVRRQRELDVVQEELAEDRDALDTRVRRAVARESEKLDHELETTRRQLEDARSDRDGYFTELESVRTLQRQFGDLSPAEVLERLRQAERRGDELEQVLRERPDARAAERLAELEHERSLWLDERSTLMADLANARGELGSRRLAAIELETLRKEKEALAAQSQILSGALDELKTRVDELTRQDDRRNPMTSLTCLDDDEGLQREERVVDPLGRRTPTLADFATDLKHRIATGVDGRTLYYSDRDVRAFLGGLAMTRLLLLQGISGTGKTSLPLAFTSAIGGDFELVEVQAGWRDRQDLLGYYNAFHRHYYATNFLQALYRAGTPQYRDRVVLIILDEINLSRPEQFFSDFLSALEQPMEKRRLTLLNDPLTSAPSQMRGGRHLPIPPNVWFVGTANHDETTAEFADKTYDRAQVMEMPRKTAKAHFHVEHKPARPPISFSALEKAFEEARTAQSGSVEHAISWMRNEAFVDQLAKRFRVGWGNRLEHQLERYLPVVVEAGGSVGEAVDHLLETKVLRKLRDRHDVRSAALEELRSELFEAGDRLDPAHPLERCDALIERELASKQGEDLV